MTVPRYGVAGDPVAHSRSPEMHLAAYAALGIDADYQRLPIPAPLFAETVRALPGSGFRGINVTIPHKEAALAVADSASDAARAIGAANTLTFRSDGTIHADNTDAPGMISAVPFDVAGRRALVLGAGGTARAACWALKDSEAEVVVVNRTHSRAAELADSLGVEAVETVPDDSFELVVHTTSVGMQETDTLDGLGKLGFTIDRVADGGAVIDFVYRDAGTPLTLAAAERGIPAIDGHELLARQGALSFAIWFNVDPPVDAMRAALA